ncbi:SAM-dependent methyltransferase [Nitrolancea hollandica]|jgi:hypothetical protein|uniref:S-adenosyl methyltransferase n=1 Tax=Nitrolancea hollandica Lb TaxID=1129897 RepID=I4ELI2_9BACT|nr:SAM-dependent methyltransferase [Nitrolancea hollandica]CCF85544.1 conserved hypothetical protein [Nitrolancea hollandica Lb]
MGSGGFSPDQESRTTKPNPARMYDYYLGGYHNFAIDREAADAAIAIWPELPLVMQANRAFLRRAVRFLVGQGIDQFLDIGSGIPTVGNVHEVAQQLNPAIRVVYVDSDPIAVAHSEFLVRANPQVAVVQQDAAQVDQLLGQPEVRALLDSGRPVAVLMCAVLHFILTDQEAESVSRAIIDALPPGSYVAISHASAEGVPPETHEQMMRLYDKTSSPMVGRTRAQITRLFGDLDLVEPGVVHVPLWRPEGPNDLFLAEPERGISVGGVGRKA